MSIDPPQGQARTFIVSLSIFWASWGVAVAGAATGRSAALVVVVVALPAGAVAVSTGFKIEAGVTTTFSLRDVFSPQYRRDASHRQRIAAPLNVLRPNFFRSVARSTGWNTSIVLGLLAVLLVSDLLLFVALMRSPSSN